MNKVVKMKAGELALDVYLSYHSWDNELKWSVDLNTTCKYAGVVAFIPAKTLRAIYEIVANLNSGVWMFNDKDELVEIKVVDVIAEYSL